MTFTKKIKHLLSNSWLILALVQLHLFATPKSTANFSKLTPLCPLTLGTAFTPVSCDGGTNGTASVSISGGSGNYSYVWSVAGQTGVTATNLPAATYTITVTDNTGGCTATASVTVTQPLPVGLTTTQKNISCMGLSNGTATANPTGGNGSFTYSWSNGQSAKTSSGLVAGSYTVKVTDQKGCTQTISVTLTQPTALTVSATKTNVLCFGGNTGTATATTGGGITSYTYAWSTSPAQNSAAATGLSNGGYTLTVTDANGCTITTSVNITQPTALTAGTTKTNVLCFGGNTGTAAVTAAGGITGYTYAWNSVPSQNTASVTSLSNGGYTVTVTDANGCTISSSVNITQPPLLTTTTSFINLTCYNYGNGSSIATPAGGTPAYSYKWSITPQTGASATNLSAGSYTVTITDANGCTTSSNVTITEPPAPIKNQSGINISCFGQNDGKAWVTPHGSKSPYQYAWNPSLSINDTIFSLVAGNYSVTVTDAAGCKQSTVIIITQPSLLTGTGSSTNNSCNGIKDGSVTIVPAGGTPGYTYSWNTSPSQSTATATNLGPGTYTIKLTDSHACEFYTTVIVTEAPPLFINAPTITKETCLLGNGKVSISVLGGNPPFTYSWSAPANTQTTPVVSNLAAGAYTVTITDSRGCTTTKSATVTNQFSPPTAVAGTANNVTCFGAKNGKAVVTPSAGTMPYSFNWSPSGGIGMTASNLSPGTYSVTVTDANGCTITSTTQITEPASIKINPASTDVSCGLANGTASVSPSGGTVPYSILWSNSSSATSVSNLAAGTYTVTVTDAGNCTATTNITINNANPLVINLTPTHVTCNGAANGAISVTASGSGGSFNYSWSPSGGTGVNVTGLAPGTYTVTVTDAGNAACFGTSTVTITQPAILTAPITIVDISCAGSNSGQASVLVSGGTGPYSYAWSNSNTTSALTGLAAGGYTVTVTDSKGCTSITNGTVIQNSNLTISVTGTNIQCFGQSTGEAVVTANGGSVPYTYNWTPAGGNGMTASNLAANTYTVAVTDASGCTRTATISITQPPNFTISTSKVNATCGSNNGTATVTPTGGLTPYTYSWSSGSAANTEANLAAGSYTVLVSDANGCTKTAVVTISVSNPLTVPSTKTNVTCNGNADGTGTINTTGGTGSYSYNWSPGGYATNSVTGLVPGVYTITVTDNGSPTCPVTTTITITEPAVLNANVTGVNITCNGNGNGSASSGPTGGTTPYAYNWSSGGNANSITGLNAGTYTVTVTDSKSCTATATIAITQGSALAVSINAQADVTCFGLSNGSASITASGGTGALTYSWTPTGGTGATVTGMPANTYTVSIKDASNCSSTITITITQPPNLVLTPSTTIASCGASDGTATILASGGTSPYTYNWSTGGTNTSISNLSPGTYNVTVSDVNGCSKTQTLNVVTASPIALVTNKTDLVCNGPSNNGTAGVIATGGTGSYNYAWAPGGAATSGITGLAAGTYTVTVTDAINSACTTSATIIINPPVPVTVTLTPKDIICYGQTSGTVTATPSGGATPYTYNWSPVAGTGSVIINLSAGNYSLTVTDINGCTASSSAIVSEPPLLTVKLDSINVTCMGTFDGSIIATVNGGVPAYTYNWAPTGGPTDSIGGLGPGVYTLTVTDANGCTKTSSISITEPPPFHITTTKKDPTCYINNGEAYLTITGGSGSFSYTWTPNGSTNDTITGLGPGTYQVHVIDNASGCDTLGTVTLAYPIVALSLNAVNVTCQNFNNAKAWVVASGASAPYTYSWSFNASINDTISGLSPGTYSVTVKDKDGCIKTDSVKVTEPTLLALTKTSTDVSCFAGNDGTMGITPAGGTTPYTYSWSSGQTSATINGLTAGTYKITLRDSNNCEVLDSITIIQSLKMIVHADSAGTSCSGGTDGKVFAVSTGGTGAYTYSWTPGGGVKDTVNNLASGIYTVTVTDAKGCTATDAVNVPQPTPLTLALNKVDVSCGLLNGRASVVASGSNGVYTYNWAPTVSSNDTITNLAIGWYTVTVSDSKSCTKIDSIQISEPVITTVTTGKTNVICNGAANGTANVTVSGGSGSFIYAWNPGGNTSSAISNLGPGTYKVTVTDQSNVFCVLVDSVIITEPTAILPVMNSTNLTCFGKGDGSAGVSVTGGTGTYTYTWSNASAGSGTSNLIAGTYTVTITDSNACTSTGTTTITEPTLLEATADSVNISCNGYTDGKVSAVANGGTAPYNFTWSPGNVLNDTVYNVAAGTFTVTVSDANSCTATRSVTITQPPGMTLTMNRTNAACNTSIGTAGVSVAGGNSPYAYLWSNGNTTANISGLYKGTYIVTVTDNKGCTKSDSIKVTEPNGVVISFTSTNITCNGANNGKITVTAAGGTGAYIYSWIPGGATSTTLTGLAAGKYVIKITDAGNLICSSKDSVTILEPAILSGTMSSTGTKCFGDSSGAVAVLGIGGTPAYTYAWTPVISSNPNVTGLKSGTYTVNIRDSHGCTAVNTVTVTQPALVSTTINASQAYCGQANGEIYVSAGGGTGAYTYSWTPVYTANDTLKGLLPGNYYVYVNDSNGCTKKDSATITLSNGINTVVTRTNITCFGAKNGQAKIFANGGSGTFTYMWTPVNNTNQNIYNLAPGMYTVSVADVNITGCIKVDSILITEPAILDVNVAVSKSTCFGGNDYIATANPTGGTPGYTYAWSIGGTGQVADSLSPGSYIIAVTDSNGCDTAKIFNVSSLSTPIILPPAKINPKCNLANGSITETIFGGQAPYHYSWSPIADTTANPKNLSAGIYTLTVTDSYGCTDSRTVTLINTSLPPSVLASANPAVCFGSSTGDASATANAGSLPYAYSWGPSGGTNSTAGGLPAGIYTITVTDGQACTATTIATVTEPPDITIVLTASTISCFGNSGGTITAVVGGGTPGYSYSWSSGGTTLTETNLIAGQYYFSVTDLNACVKSDTVDVLQPPVLDATISVVNNVSCLGGSNGKIKVSVTGGTPIYTYSWTPVSGTDSILASLTPDTYSVTIIDSSGCSVTRSAVITEPAPFAAVVTKKNISCFGSKDGQAKIVVTGGSLPYIYSWSPITNFTDSASGIDAISFTITVIDSLGCTYTHSDSLTQPPPLTLQTVSTAAHCSKNDGSLIAAVTGGTPPYNYLWNPSGNTNSSADSLVSGNYSLTVTDLNGCTITQGDSIANIPGPILSITSVTNSTCANTCVGTATSQLSGGTGPYSYSWNTVPAQFDSVAVNMCVGNYFIQITDSAGCVDTANVTIGSPTINIVLTALDTDICIGQISHLTATATGGTPSYTYNWNNGAYTGQNYDVTPGVTTTYTVIATDSTGCPSDSATVTVKVKPPIDVIASGTPAASCHGTPTKLSVTATGGDGNYSYTWQPGGFVGTDTTVVPDVTTTYTIIGNDGCGTQPDTTLITVKVHPRPVAQFVSNDTSGCMFTCTGFNDQSTIIAGDTITSWHWNFGDGQTSNLKDPTNCYRAVGQYKVSLSVRTSNGCVDTIVKNGFITIHGLPKAEFTIKPDSVSVLEPLVNFTDAATDAVSWKWDFGDGSTVDSLNYVQNPRHTYKDTGRYCVWQFVTNMYGCVDSIKHCLKVYPEFTFYIPNAFSPNGDIFNETFNGKGTFIKEYEMIIFDRWGNLIYTTNNLNIGWDGRANEGKDVAQQDVYVWKVNIIDIFDREHHYIGHVTLVK